MLIVCYGTIKVAIGIRPTQKKLGETRVFIRDKDH